MTTTDTSTAPNLEDLAPYPAEPADQTAGALARHLTAETFARSVRIPRLLREWEAKGRPTEGPERDAFSCAVELNAASYGLILALRGEFTTEMAYDPYNGEADRVEDDLTNWLDEYGIDAETIIQAVWAEAARPPVATIDAAHLSRQRAFSERTFGPGPRTAGVVDHIRKELVEIEAAPDDLSEWVDVVILALDGAWRAGHGPQEIIDAIVAKQARNEARVWPDWRTADPGKAIEHDRSVSAEATR